MSLIFNQNNLKTYSMTVRADELTTIEILNILKANFPEQLLVINKATPFLNISIENYQNLGKIAEEFPKYCSACFYPILKDPELKVEDARNIYRCKRCGKWFKL